MAYYDRYSKFRVDGEIKVVPRIRIANENTDLHIVYNKDRMRMDMLSRINKETASHVLSGNDR